VRYPAPQAGILRGTDSEGSAFFGARVVPQVPAILSRHQQRAVFLVDVSASSNPDRMNVWLDLLAAILERNRGSLDEFAVLFFNVETFWWREEFTANTAAAVREVIAFARTLTLEGATDLHRALREADRPFWAGGLPGEWDLLLLSDGAKTWGADLSPAVHSGPVFGYLTGIPGTDTDSLERITAQTGGALFSVLGESDLAAAAVAHRRRPWRLLGIRVEGGSDVVVAGRPTDLYPGQVLRLAGRGAISRNAKIEIEIASAEGSRKLVLRPQWCIRTDAAARAYGEIAVAQLEELGAAVSEEACAYASHFRVVGRSCSLLMLETERDYGQFGIRAVHHGKTVKNHPASVLIERHGVRARTEATDPRAALLGKLRLLEQADGVEFEISKELRKLISSVPIDRLRLPEADLDCMLRTTSGAGADYLRQLLFARLSAGCVRDEVERRRKQYSTADALRALSSLVEHDPGDLDLIRGVASSALALGQPEVACRLFLRVIRARPHEPVPWMGLAVAAEDAGMGDLALIYHEAAFAARWIHEGEQLRWVQASRYFRLLTRIVAGEIHCFHRNFAKKRLQALRPSSGWAQGGLVVYLTWNTNRSDIDLHVVDPTETRCFHGFRKTRIGGRLRGDVTTGYGPEMFSLWKPIPGKYLIELDTFATNDQRTTERIDALVTIYTNWATPEETVRTISVPLKSTRGCPTVATIRID